MFCCSLYAAELPLQRMRGGALSQKLKCRSCWRSEGSMCVQCGLRPAQNERRLMHPCQSCVPSLSPQAHYIIVREESDAYLQKIEAQHQWSEDSPALQLLLLPKRTMPALPQHEAEPAYIGPQHCRLCLASVTEETLPDHLVSVHQIRISPVVRARSARAHSW